MPQPVGPTIATRSPLFTSRSRHFISGLSATYENATAFAFTMPSAWSSTRASGASGSSVGSSISANIRSAHTNAFWNSVITPDISLNGFVYWLA